MDIIHFMDVDKDVDKILEKIDEIYSVLSEHRGVDEKTIAIYTALAVLRKAVESQKIKIDTVEELRRRGYYRVVEIDGKYLIVEKKEQ